jgi:hypothetical protein
MLSTFFDLLDRVMVERISNRNFGSFQVSFVFSIAQSRWTGSVRINLKTIFLSITLLDCKLTFNVQIDYIASKAMIVLGFIKRFGKKFKDPYVHKVLYCTYVRSILEFASSV